MKIRKCQTFVQLPWSTLVMMHKEYLSLTRKRTYLLVEVISIELKFTKLISYRTRSNFLTTVITRSFKHIRQLQLCILVKEKFVLLTFKVDEEILQVAIKAICH